MKIGLKANIFNAHLVSRRKELGLTQKTLSELAHVGLDVIQAIEQLRMPSVSILHLTQDLISITKVLECDFDYLFPDDYLSAIQSKKLPRRRIPWIWEREISLETLPPGTQDLFLPSPEELFIDSQNIDKNEIREAMKCLTDCEREVLEMRFGFVDGLDHTLKEVSQHLEITCERVRQIEANALRKLRHPSVSRPLREIID